MGKKKTNNFDRSRGRDAAAGPSARQRNETPIAAVASASAAAADGDDDSSDELPTFTQSVKIYMWEFGQNDPKRDSGSKLCRLGYASTIRVGQNFGGIVLSSETETIISPADANILLSHGIAGINCSWNRLEEIPFSRLGKNRNQRVLPLLVAANTVNYGKPFKMNTAEAIAAALYICGFREDARALMSTFSYGEEFLRLNHHLLEMYAACENSAQIRACQDQYMTEQSVLRDQKDRKREARLDSTSGYIDEADLPPMDSDDEYECEQEEAEPYNVDPLSTRTETSKVLAETNATATTPSRSNISLEALTLSDSTSLDNADE